jgi:hypothetical protein
MLSTGITSVRKIDAGLVIHAGVEEHVVRQLIFQRRLLHFLRQTAETSPVIRDCAAPMRNDETQRREVMEEVRREALHERGRIGIQVARARRMEARIAARAHVNHRGYVVLDHLFVDRIPIAISSDGLRRSDGWPIASRDTSPVVPTLARSLTHINRELVHPREHPQDRLLGVQVA